jgi:hypothetical protein
MDVIFFSEKPTLNGFPFMVPEGVNVILVFYFPASGPRK